MFNKANKNVVLLCIFGIDMLVRSRLPVLKQGLITLQFKEYLLISENLYCFLNFVLYNAWFINEARWSKN